MPPTDPRLVAAAQTVNDVIADRAIRHAVFMERYKTGVVNKIVTLLNREVMPSVLSELDSRLARLPAPGIQPTPRSVQRLRELSVAVWDAQRAGWINAGAALRSELSQLAVSEGEWLRRVVQGAMPFELDLVTPPTPLLRSVVTSRPMQGRLLRDWWNKLQTDMRGRVVQTINIGMARGDSTSDMIRALRGTRANRFADGVLQTTRRETATIVRTAVRHVQAQAHAETAKANEDVIAREKWLSTLDHRTSQICQSLDGQVFKVGEGIYPPAHHQCRSIRVPITKSWKEMGIDLKDPPPSTRAAKNYSGGIRQAVRGEVPSDVTYGQWLRRQPATVQDSILGPGKGRLFRRGNVPIEKFTDSNLRPLTLRQLEELEDRLTP